MLYFRPIPQTDPARPMGALILAGGWSWFDRAEVLSRQGSQGLIAAEDLPETVRAALTRPRAAVAGLGMDEPRLMGVLNTTPDSFSDGGRFDGIEAALTQAHHLAKDADILDIGGESTRPGAATVAPEDEIARTAPLIAALRQAGLTTPVSIDSRKAAVAVAALDAGASMVNDVSALGHDPALGRMAAERCVPVCLMHAQGGPETMQDDPRYDDVLLDVYDDLAQSIALAEAAGISRDRIVIDPGIGFGKTLDHNLTLIRGISLFHGLGCPILLGVSRKRFIGTLADQPQADKRGPGTIAVTLAAIAQGVQIHRVHDTQDTRQALRLWRAVTKGTLR